MELDKCLHGLGLAHDLLRQRILKMARRGTPHSRVQLFVVGPLCCCCHDVSFTVVTRKTLTTTQPSAEFADGAQETPPALPFRYPGNFIRESVSYFGPRLPIPMWENFGFVTHTHAALEALCHRSRLLNRHSGFYAHRYSPLIHSRRYAGQFASVPNNLDYDNLFDTVGVISLTNVSLDGVQNCSKRISLPSIGAS